MAIPQFSGPFSYNVKVPEIASPVDLLQAQGLQSQNALRNLQVQGQQEIQNVFAQPGAINPATGQVSANALTKVAQYHPEAAALMAQRQALMDQERAKAASLQEETRRKRAQELEGHSADIGAQGVARYEDALASTGAADKAQEETIRFLRDTITKKRDSGIFTPQEADKLIAGANGFNYADDKALLTNYKQAQAEKLLQTKADESWSAATLPGEPNKQFKVNNKTGEVKFLSTEGGLAKYQPWVGSISGMQIVGKPPMMDPFDRAAAVAAGGIAGRQGAMTQMMGDSSLTGNDYLRSLPAGTGSLIKGLSEGKVPITTFSTRPQAGQLSRDQAIQMAIQYDPEFSQTRAKVMLDFASGKPAENITRINTALQHMGSMYDLAEALKSGQIPAANAAINFIRTNLGHPEVTNLETAQLAVSEEMKRVFTEVGAGTLQEQQAWYDKFRAAKSPEQFQGSSQVAGKLLEGRIEALNSRWKRGGFKTDYPGMIDEANLPVLKKLGISSAIAGRAEGAAGVETATPSSTKVVTPDGQTHTFPTAEAAAQFKKAAGLQ